MAKGILILFSVVFTISCKSGSGGGGGGVKGVSVNPNGFKATGPATKGDLPERYTVGCVTPGENTPNNEIDSRLRVGHEFSLDFRNSEESGYMAATGVQRVTAITANSITSNYRVTSNVNAPIPSNNFNEVCTKTADGAGGYDWICDGGRALSSMNAAKSFANDDCVVHIEKEEDYEESMTPGTYLGRKAYFASASARGKVLCNNDTVDLGMGSLVMNFVYSNQTPATDITYCGGTALFVGSETKLESGKVISAGMSSITQAPVVSE